MSALTFTPGKFYKTRDGRHKIEVIAIGRNFFGGYSIMGLRTTDEGVHIASSFTANGRLYKDSESPGDLIAEWKDAPEVDWSKMPEGAVALAQWRHDGPWLATDTVPTAGVHSFLFKDKGRSWELYPQHVPKWSGDWRDSLVTRPTEGGK